MGRFTICNKATKRMIEYLLENCFFCDRELVANRRYSLEEYGQILNRCEQIVKLKVRIGKICMCEDCAEKLTQLVLHDEGDD